MDLNITPATEYHLKGILEIVNYNILHTTALYDYEPKSLTDMEIWFSDKQKNNWPVIVATINYTVVGYGSFGSFRTKEACKFTIEHSVYVSTDHSGKGIGGHLLTELIRLAKDKGYHTMIGAIDADNNGSISFHEKFGFKDAGTVRQAAFKFDRWLDLTFMQLLLK
ncbi:MAG: N-acetyltransferase family protein [Flavobacterium sp.]|nr:MAG: N-acetyltransferase family protein [Flavobacterium sp.]